jgi:hypothetical protein
MPVEELRPHARAGEELVRIFEGNPKQWGPVTRGKSGPSVTRFSLKRESFTIKPDANRGLVATIESRNSNHPRLVEISPSGVVIVKGKNGKPGHFDPRTLPNPFYSIVHGIVAGHGGALARDL